ncbi:MAG TPA: radical SAM protein [Solirubrobacterales bacterium]|nr:radical SAM protein [Solirubrobacterales bacterium]
MTATLDHRQLYRLPWSLPDNAIAWLEPTKKCNLACLGCYRENDPRGHKTLEEVRRDLEVFKRYRTVDGVSIAGGDPLVHPEIAAIVRMVAQDGLKPIVNTNGLALTPELLGELRDAGVAGFTFHIDSKQGRPGWKDKDEAGLNELRLRFAELVAEVGGGRIGCSFNATVYEDTLEQVPDVLEWAQRHIDVVHTVVFIAFRAGVVGGGFEYQVKGEPVDFLDTPYATTDLTRHEIQSTDIVAEIRRRFPEFEPAAYLNGTERPDTFKWLLSGRLGTPERIYGYVGPRSMELAQTWHHLTTGRYLAYTDPRMLGRGRAMLLLAPLDRRLRKIARRYGRAVATDPGLASRPLRFQSVMIIQPADIYADGHQNMCDGCPDMTVWNDRLVWSCRLEEPEKFGDFVQMVPRESEPV